MFWAFDSLAFSNSRLAVTVQSWDRVAGFSLVVQSHNQAMNGTMSEREPLIPQRAKLGEFHPAPEGASRSPCPVVNALANHGYLERSGRNIYMKDLNASMSHVGMSSLLGSVFAIPTYFEYHNPAQAYLQKPVSLLTRLWELIKNPYTFFSYFGCWKRGQESADGKKYSSHHSSFHEFWIGRGPIPKSLYGQSLPQEFST